MDKSNSTFLASFKLIDSGVLNAIFAIPKLFFIRSISNKFESGAGPGPVFALAEAFVLAATFALDDLGLGVAVASGDGLGAGVGVVSGKPSDRDGSIGEGL